MTGKSAWGEHDGGRIGPQWHLTLDSGHLESTYIPLRGISARVKGATLESSRSLRTRSQSVSGPAAALTAPIRTRPPRPPNRRPTRTVRADHPMPLRMRDPKERPTLPRRESSIAGPVPVGDEGPDARPARALPGVEPLRSTPLPADGPGAPRPDAQGTTARSGSRRGGVRPDLLSSAHCSRRIPQRVGLDALRHLLANALPARRHRTEGALAIEVRRNPSRTHAASPSFSFACASSTSSAVARRMSNANAISSSHWGRMPANR